MESGDEKLIEEKDKTGRVAGVYKELTVKRAVEEIEKEPPPLDLSHQSFDGRRASQDRQPLVCCLFVGVSLDPLPLASLILVSNAPVGRRDSASLAIRGYGCIDRLALVRFPRACPFGRLLVD